MSSEREAISALTEHIIEINGEPRVEVDVDGRRHTIELRPIHDFERGILDDLIDPGAGTDVSGAAVPVKGRWIHGWLDSKGEDYINNIWKNYQYFLKYIEARTSTISNVDTHNRSPGTYDSMYRYLLILEDLELLERYRRQSVPQSEYDFPVPEEFRTRTYIRLQSDYRSKRDKWDNPYGAMYGSLEEESETVDIPVETVPEEEEDAFDLPQKLESVPEDADESEDITDVEGEGLEEFTEEEPEPEPENFDIPDKDASITDFPDKQSLVSLIDESFPEALERTFAEAPISTSQVQPEDFGPGQKAVYGSWVVGSATPGQTSLELIISIDDTRAELSPGFIPSGIQEHLGDVMRDNNPYPDIFPNYFIISSYNSVFMRTVDEVVRNEQVEHVYYNLQDMQMEELS